jgi:transketolase
MSQLSKVLAKNIRTTSLQMVSRAGASHIGSALSIADILAVLYTHIMEFNPADQDYPNRDRLILSKGHACVSLYAALHHVGIISGEEILTYAQDFSNLMSHVSHKANGVEFSTGALGHGLPFGLGKAMTAKVKGEKWRTLVIAGDGEMQEGSSWEALMFASHHNVKNLTLIIDANNLQSLTTVDNTLAIEPLQKKIEAFGWSCSDIDGHDHDQIREALSKLTPIPHCIIARTIKGKGVSYMENQVAWHYKCPNPEELKIALIEINNA